MYFDSFSSFIEMGGHGLYVWLCYGIFLAIVFWNLLMLKIGRTIAIKEAKRTWRRENVSQNQNETRGRE